VPPRQSSARLVLEALKRNVHSFGCEKSISLATMGYWYADHDGYRRALLRELAKRKAESHERCRSQSKE
jgi:hypothetical protein